MRGRYDNHTHTHKSNIINRDSTNFEDKLIDRALDIGLSGISITDHANISAHVKALAHLDKLRKEVNDDSKCFTDDFATTMRRVTYKERVNNFKLGLGTEIYLVDREQVKDLRSRNEYIKFYHLVVVAKNYEGYRAIAELSSQSWEDSFTYRGMDRVPTYKDYFVEWARKNSGNVIVSSACLGSEFATLALAYADNPNEKNKVGVNNFIFWMKSLFGEDFYIELQPSRNEEQITYNLMAIQIAHSWGIKCIITTDAHYLSKDKQEIHSRFLKSQDAERETSQFYESTYLMDDEELRSYFPYFTDEQFENYLSNTLEIHNKIETYSLYKDIEVPKTKIELQGNFISLLYPVLDEDIHKFTLKFYRSEYEVDRILVQQLEKGLYDNEISIDARVLDRIEKELKILWLVSEKLNQRLANYYLMTKEIVHIISKVSLVGISRGSAGSFLICNILGITQINPLDFELDEWRHLSVERPELPDIDIDSQAGERGNILELIKQYYGHDKVLNICTFKTEGSASAIQTMCRGMDIPVDVSTYLSSLVPDGMSIKECMKHYKTDKECNFLIKELMAYEGLLEGVLEIESLCCGRSVHASGVYIYNDSYWLSNALMKAPNGQPITQYDMNDSDYQGGLKVDILTIEALDRMRKAMDLLLDDGILEWQGDLKSTYDKYLHPRNLELKDERLWKALREGKVLNAFQYDSIQGKSAIFKIKPESFREAMDGNALMRLSCEGEQPIDRYVKHKKNISLWYDEMRREGLNEQEISIMEKHLLKSYGCAITQEATMRLSLDPKVAGFDLVLANKLRKAIAKAKAKHLIAEVKDLFFKKGLARGNRMEILNYVWVYCVEPQLGYAFSEPHLAGYTLVLVQEIVLSVIYSELHWKVACLAVDAGDINEDVTKATDYGALAKAIGDMEQGFVTPPYINSAKVGFSPNKELNNCAFGLGALNGISIDLAKEIIKLRPYSSFQDFYDRCVITKIVQPSKTYTLIKAGVFDQLNSDRVRVMYDFVNLLVPDKEKLTSANIQKLVSFGAVPPKFREQLNLHTFKKLVFSKSNLVKMYNKTQGLYLVPNNLSEYMESIKNEFMEALDFDDNGQVCLKSKEFDKKYKEMIAPLTEWLASEEALNIYNYYCKNEVWMKNCIGSIEKWEMDSLSYYTNKHELDALNLQEYFDIVNFKELPTVPESYEYYNKNTGRTYLRNNLSVIAGVVVDKNKMKSMITLNTQYGVVEVKLHKDLFTQLSRKLPNDDSWFKRGTKLVVVGVRRGETFYPKNYYDSKYSVNIMKIEVNAENKVYFVRERAF